jgi:enoyl-CoA hydratase
VSVDRRPDGVAIVRLDAPKLNALSTAVLAQLIDVVQDLTRDPPGAVVIWGGDRAFAAGADVGEFGGVDQARVISSAFRRALDAVADIPRVTIAAITGYALGGGCELALACDFRVAADTAKVGQPEVSLGIIPGGGATQRLPRLIGQSRAKELIFSGKQLRAEEALRIGLVDRVFRADRVLYEATIWAYELACGAIAAQGLAKSAIDQGLDGPLATGLDLETELFARVFTTEDSRIGIASFRERGPGKAKFIGR